MHNAIFGGTNTNLLDSIFFRAAATLKRSGNRCSRVSFDFYLLYESDSPGSEFLYISFIYVVRIAEESNKIR